MAQELDIIDSKEVVAYGFVTYTQEVAALAAQGYVVDIRSRYSPQWQIGLFVCNMLLLEDEDGKEEVNVPPVVEPVVVAEDTSEIEEPFVHPIVDTLIVAPVKKAAGRPSKADKAKAELQAKLGDAASSQR